MSLGLNPTAVEPLYRYRGSNSAGRQESRTLYQGQSLVISENPEVHVTVTGSQSGSIKLQLFLPQNFNNPIVCSSESLLEIFSDSEQGGFTVFVKQGDEIQIFDQNNRAHSVLKIDEAYIMSDTSLIRCRAGLIDFEGYIVHKAKNVIH